MHSTTGESPAAAIKTLRFKIIFVNSFFNIFLSVLLVFVILCTAYLTQNLHVRTRP